MLHVIPILALSATGKISCVFTYSDIETETLTYIASKDDDLEKRLTSTSCAICQLAVQEVEGLVEDKKTETEIASVLSQLCKVLPSPESTECASFVKEWTPRIINDVATGASPNLVCTALAQC